MGKFKDCSGREFTLCLMLGHRPKLREIGIDPTNFVTAITTLTQATATDADKLVEVCRLLTVEPTGDDYGDYWSAETMVSAGEALASAVTDFYLPHRPTTAAEMKRLVGGLMERMDAEMSQALTRSESATSLPASAG